MNGYLILEDGASFEGEFFGAKFSAPIIGEVVFSTNTTGFQEELTDPNYRGQILTQTFPLVGNVGINPENSLSESFPEAVIIRECCEEPSNFREKGKFEDFLKEKNVTGLSGIDTRRLTRHIRENGAMNGIITDNPNVDLNAVKAFKFKRDLPKHEPISFKANNSKYNIALLDFGYDKRIVDALLKQGCSVTILNYDTDISALENYDLILLSNGAGNPNDYPEAINAVKTLINFDKAIIGIGLGSQLLALAKGGEVIKLKSGHRGGQPVLNLRSGRVFTTSQNHGYAVSSKKLTESLKDCEELFKNVNDGTNEGMIYKNAVGVQFTPDDEDLIALIRLLKP